MTSTPILAARPSVTRLVSPKVGAVPFPVKSILRESSARSLEYSQNTLKRKMDDRYDNDAQHSADKKRRLAADNSDEESDVEEDDNGQSQSSEMQMKKITDGEVKAELIRNGEESDATGDENDAGTGTPAMVKRQKTVHFDMNLNITTEVGRRTLEETKLLVRRALDSHALAGRPGHDDQDFIELVDVFSHDTEAYRDPRQSHRHGSADDDDGEGNMVPPDELVLYVVALTASAPLLNKSCINLVRKMLACSWIGRDDKFFRAYVQFLAALVSAQGAYLRPVLEMIVDRFKEPSASSWTVPDFPPVSRETTQKRLHFGLKYMLRLFPAARMLVSKLVAQKFPFPAESKSIHMYYVDNLLRLREYAPTIGLEILETITSQLVKIDTEFQLDLSDMDDDLAAKVVLELARKNAERDAVTARRLDDERDDSDDSDSDVDEDDDLRADRDEFDSDSEADETDIPQFGDPDYNEELARVDKSTRLVEKLDSTLDRLFALFTPVFEDPDSAAAHRCMEDMLSDFANFVLTVPSSRHTQFLVFHFSQKSLALQDMFTGTLLNLGFESNRPAAVRQSAAAYLSSYVARAARVPRDTVRSVASILCHRIESYRRRHVATCRGPDLRRFQELYSWVQALLYIFCFRWRDLVDAYPDDLVDPEDPASFVGKELEWMSGLKHALSNIIYSTFNPLMVCSPPIVAEFAKLAHSLHLMYVFPRIESNKSIHLSSFASGRYGHGDALREDAGYTVEDEKWLQLEGNFPFDPYNLPISKRWLEGDYVSWTPISGLGADGDSDDSDSDSESYDEDGDDRF
ncbi:RNA polymerase I-specific transcription initiation factor RRN3 [Sporothrix schenckii 1099-18]|uniref:RNA polymerase I-specific transcription initiation factor RRN3 n=1 Tax=Sporothrix schenckii 1099-18 TaxID=1397361 RepID=A0A0F2M349_SPOSC|nr:RNA polymerase I-specific transcription initiation factor RRN3 [Sporothrix schenckii 1099-18]KJR82566.1 RNA polymerase I-specific transcription initiation factor RRN3 [Sporothrix schenckii 1099-18]